LKNVPAARPIGRKQAKTRVFLKIKFDLAYKFGYKYRLFSNRLLKASQLNPEDIGQFLGLHKQDVMKTNKKAGSSTPNDLNWQGGYLMKSSTKAGFYTPLILTLVTLYLSFSATAAKGDWKSDANARIEQIRKTTAEITVLDSGGNPINDVNVQIAQTDHRFAFGTCIAYGALT
jgi:hypothetical protein